jgi:hypothetical protein
MGTGSEHCEVVSIKEESSFKRRSSYYEKQDTLSRGH